MDKQELLNILVDNQLKNIPEEDRLSFSDISRLVKFLDNSIFEENDCVKWNGYYENNGNRHRSCGITFYFKGQKKVVHRLLYINFKGPIQSNVRVCFSCEQGPYCCNINHMFLRKYQKSSNKEKEKRNDTVFKIKHDVDVKFD